MDCVCLNIFNDLKSFIINEEELKSVMESINTYLNSTFEECVKDGLESSKSLINDKKLQIESVLDYIHDELNTGHWSEVSLNIRRAFTAASYIKTLILLKSSTICTETLLEECLKCLDMGLLLGAPLEVNSDLLTNSASYITKKLQELFNKCDNNIKLLSKAKRKVSSEYLTKFANLKGFHIDITNCPSIETFNSKYFKNEQPVKLQECMTHWPAVKKWIDLDYLLKVAGNRTIPVEIGSHYVDENWCQKLMTLKDFIKNYFLGEADNIGYLAQHNLFNQIAELRNDIYIPEYCCLGESDDDPDINAWLGPAGTVSPLHYDPKNNILAQVFGTKQLILFSPKDNEYLYPHEGMLSNTSQVDPENPDSEKFPKFGKATPYKCLLEPGEMLYIPPKWWHHVTALDKSFSVSFWWS